jgi:3-oxoacyl-[acyl-carrier-protein] synthase II
MTLRLAIQGIGAVGAFGSGTQALRQALCAGEVPVGTLQIPTAATGTLELPAYRADTAPLEEFVSKRALRRIDHFSRLALLGGYLALQDAGRLEADRSRLGVVIATGYGAMQTTFAFLDSFLDGGDVCSSPTHFSNSVHNAAAANLSILLGATGPSLTVSQFELSVPTALLTARQWLAEGRVDAVLLGGVDELGAVLGYCWHRFFGVPDGLLRPLEIGRQSAIPGEGAAFFLLTREGEVGGGHHGLIEEVRQGNLGGRTLSLAAGSRLLLGADGHRDCSTLYGSSLPADARAVSFAPLYGSLPVGPAFDLAVAALAAGDNRLFAPPPQGANGLPCALLGVGPFGEGVLNCLKLGRNGDYGLVSVVRG